MIAKKAKRAVYTAIFGEYDTLQPINFRSSIDFYVFTDNRELSVRGWRTVLVEPHSKIMSRGASMANRHVKMHPHIYLPSYEQTIYVDGNIKVLKNPELLYDKYLSNFDISLPPHPERADVFEELKVCFEYKKITQYDYDLIAKKIKTYKQLFPNVGAMTENNVILRRKSNNVNKAMKKWWHETEQGVVRDQISLPYVLKASDLKFQPFCEGPRTNSRFFTIRPHHRPGMSKGLLYLLRSISVLRTRSRFYKICYKIIVILKVMLSIIKIRSWKI